MEILSVVAEEFVAFCFAECNLLIYHSFYWDRSRSDVMRALMIFAMQNKL